MNCKKCNAQNEGNQNYCGYCGTTIQVKRLEWKFIFEEIQQVFNFEKGILFTIREMSIRPGKAVREFLDGDRQRLVKPIFFLFATSVVYSLIIEWFNIELYPEKKIEIQQFNSGLKWISSNLGYMNIFLCFIYSFWSSLLFPKQNYNFIERFIFFCYSSGMVMLLIAINSLAHGIIKIQSTNNVIGTIISNIYYLWSMVLFFQDKKLYSLLKAILILLLGYLSIFILSLVVVFLFVFLSKIF
jgi:hypothetical protein